MGTQTLVPNQYRLHKWDGPLEIKETGGAMVTGNIAIIPPDDADVHVESLSITENGTYTAPEGTAYSPITVNVTNRLHYTLHENQEQSISHVIYFAEDVLDAGAKTGYISSGTGAAALEQITVTVSSADSDHIVGSYTYDGVSYSDVSLAKQPAHDIIVN